MKRILNKESRAAIELMIANDLITKDVAEKYFPELRESEDERIRKLLVEAVTQVLQDQYCSNRGVSKEKVIAWLEKQGEKVKPIEGFDTEFEKQVSCLIAGSINKDYEYTKDFVKWTSDALLNYAKHELKKNSMGISEATKKKLEDSLNEALEKETSESFNKFLDEQGKQKLIDKIQIGKKYKCIASPRYSTFFRGEIYKPEDEFLCSLMNFCSDCFEPIEDNERNPTDEVGNYDHKKVLQNIIDEQNSAWSEEDEETLNTIINHFKIDIECTDEDDIVRWLKNLKKRVLPQPKQEWSEEDEKMIRALVSMCDVWATSNQFYPKENKEMEALKTWLESLKERYTWKPSDEQMNALREAVIEMGKYVSRCSIEEFHEIESLYNDLKKLRGE